MKILTLLIISLATFILGYSVAEYTETPARTYIIESDQGEIFNQKSGLEILIKNTSGAIQYISNEKPSENVKSIPVKAFLDQVDNVNIIQKKQNVVKVIFRNNRGEIICFYALPTTIKFDKDNNLLSIKAEKYINIKGSNGSKAEGSSNLKRENKTNNITVVFPY
tara:strand:- start:12969 stop:13463 length:495 start_codon:yes stop_codon:yes gene_type:complete